MWYLVAMIDVKNCIFYNIADEGINLNIDYDANFWNIDIMKRDKSTEEAGADLGQAQHKIG